MSHRAISGLVGLVGIVTSGLGGCAGTLQRQAPQPPRPAASVITRVGVEPKRFNPSAGEDATVRFALEQPAEVSVRLYDEQHELIRTLHAPTRLRPGRHAIRWDGRAEGGETVEDGVYVYTLSAIDQQRRLHLFDLADQTGGERLKIEEGGFDPQMGSLRYVLPRAARVRIRIALKEGGPLLRTLLDWAPRDAGAHEEPWNGLDASGRMDLARHPDTTIGMRAYALADNTVIVDGNPAPAAVASLRTEGTRRTLRVPQHPAAPDRYLHANHPRAACHEPALTLQLLGDLPKTPDRVPIISAPVPLRLTIAPGDRPSLLATRYELVLYVDHVFFAEEEEGYSPFTYVVDPAAVGPGPHLITVNLVTMDDHIGVATQSILVQ